MTQARRDSRDGRLHVARSRRAGKPVDKRTDIWAFGVRALRDADRPPRVRRRRGDRSRSRSLSPKSLRWDALPAATPRSFATRCCAGASRRIASGASRTSPMRGSRSMRLARGERLPIRGAIPQSRPSRARLLLPWLITAAAIAALVALCVAIKHPQQPTTRLLSDIGTDASLVSIRAPRSRSPPTVACSRLSRSRRQDLRSSTFVVSTN